MNSSKKYKALMIDVDGTLVPNHPKGMPSARVTTAINKAHPSIHIGLATGRPLFAMKYLAKHLQLSGVSIVSGGAQIVNHMTRTVEWEKTIPLEAVHEVHNLIQTYDLLVEDGINDSVWGEGKPPKKVLEMAIQAVPKKTAETIITTISHIPTITAHTVTSWTTGTVDVLINHAEATKQHGIFEVAKILGIETHEIIGIGDGGNDFPLLMACGLKVAMGNASDDLKAIADYVAPSQAEDGVAHVIEKFILNNSKL